MEEKIDTLINELNENTRICRELLEYLRTNNKQTNDIHRWVEVQLTPEQEWKNFGLNVLANVAGNAIDSPVLVDLNKLLKK